MKLDGNVEHYISEMYSESFVDIFIMSVLFCILCNGVIFMQTMYINLVSDKLQRCIN